MDHVFTDAVGTEWKQLAPVSGYYPIYRWRDGSGDAMFGYSRYSTDVNPSTNTHYHVFFSTYYNRPWYQIKCNTHHGDVLNQEHECRVENGPFDQGKKTPTEWAQFFANGLAECYSGSLRIGGKKGKRSLKNRSRKNKCSATQRKKKHTTKRRRMNRNS